MEKISQGSNSERENLEILDGSLGGKTRSELTPEQKEAEDRFCKENLEEFLSLIEEDKIMTHGAKGSLATTFEHGIASFYQRRDRRIAGLEAGRGDTPWQGENFQFLFKRIIQPYAKSYQEFLAGSLSEEALSNVKAELLEKVPEIGKERVEYFLDNTIPSFLREGVALPKQKDGMHSTDSTYAPLADSKEISAFKIDKERYPNLTKEEADQALWRRLANIIGGQDMVSSTPASYLKKNFSDKSFLSSGYGHNAYDIYFDTPPQIRMFDLTKIPMAEKDDYDIGVSSRIMPSHFRAFRGGIYDKEKRIFYLIPQITMEDVKTLSERQKEGLLLFDTDLIPLPPIESVQVLRVGITPSPINVFHDDDWDADQKDEIDAMEKISTKNREESEEAIKTIIKEKGYHWGMDAKTE